MKTKGCTWAVDAHGRFQNEKIRTASYRVKIVTCAHICTHARTHAHARMHASTHLWHKLICRAAVHDTSSLQRHITSQQCSSTSAAHQLRSSISAVHQKWSSTTDRIQSRSKSKPPTTATSPRAVKTAPPLHRDRQTDRETGRGESWCMREKKTKYAESPQSP